MAIDLVQNANMNALIQGPGVVNASTVAAAATPAKVAGDDPTALHQMLVSASILTAVILVLIVVAGFSNTAGNAVIALLGLLLLVQGITKVNPFVSWLANHPLVPTTPTSNKLGNGILT